MLFSSPGLKPSDGNSKTATCNREERVITPGFWGSLFCLLSFPPEQAASPRFPLLAVAPQAQAGLSFQVVSAPEQRYSSEAVRMEPASGQIQVKL